MENNVHKLIIIGSGPAGLTAGIYASRANLNPIIFQGPEPGGQLMGTSIVENWPGEKSINGPELMIKMQEHTKQLGAQLISENIARVDFSQRPFKIWTDRNQEFQAEAIIIASGATPKKLGVPGEDTYWGKGITTCAICDAAFYVDKKVVIVGGGDTAMEDASFLKKFTKNITVVQILDHLTASQAMQQRVVNDPDIKIMYESSVTEVHGNEQHLTEVVITNQKTGEKITLPADGLFIAIGLKPNTEPFKDQIKLDQWGYIQVENNTRTSVEGVFSAGDVHDYRYRQAITAAGSGCMAALDAERFLS